MGLESNDLIEAAPTLANNVPRPLEFTEDDNRRLIRRYEPKETVCNEGDEAKTVFLVVSGRVKIYKTSINGKRQVVRFLQPGEWIAELGCDEYRHSAEALKDTTLRLWAKSEVAARMRSDASFSLLMFENVTQSLIAAENQLLVLGRKKAGEKVATYLLSFVPQPSDASDENAPVIDLPVQRADIADYLGMSVETVCRKITEFTRCGVIDAITATKLRINNLGALRYMASADDAIMH